MSRFTSLSSNDVTRAAPAQGEGRQDSLPLHMRGSCHILSALAGLDQLLKKHSPTLVLSYSECFFLAQATERVNEVLGGSPPLSCSGAQTDCCPAIFDAGLLMSPWVASLSI